MGSKVSKQTYDIWEQGKTFGTTTQNTAPTAIDGNVVQRYVARLNQNKKYLTHLLNDRGLTKQMVDKFAIGCDNQRITIPVFDSDGKTLLNIRRYLPPPRRSNQHKMLPFKRGFDISLFPLNFVNWNKPIILCEGEWDCILLYQNGFNGLTVAGGIRSWNNRWYQLFAQKAVIIIYDVNDADGIGQQVANERASELSGVAKTVKIVKLPLPDYIGGDITNYFVDEQHIGKDLQKLIRRTPVADIQAPHLDIVWANNIQRQTVAWLYERYIPLKGLTLLVGLQGSAKSFLACHIAAKFSKGLPIMNGTINVGGDFPKGGTVLYLDSENPKTTSLIPRLLAAQADTKRIGIISCYRKGQSGKPVWIDLQRDLTLVEKALQKHSSCKLLIYDALNSFIGRANPLSDPSIRQVLDPLNNLADRYGVAMLGVLHFNKRSDEVHYLHRTSGSGAYLAASRAAFYVGYNPNVSDQVRPRARVISPAKFNDLDVDAVPVYGFCITSNALGDGVIQFEDEPVIVSAAQIASGRPLLQNQCAALITRLLHDGPVLAAVIQPKVLAQFTSKTMERAKQIAGAESFKLGTPLKKGDEPVWYWRLVGDRRKPR